MSSAKNNNHLYRNKWTRIDTILGEISFLAKLTRAQEDYRRDHEYQIDKFLEWLYNTYGVTVVLQEGSLTSEYKVHDEKKFLLFTLKYT